ncbi:MAG TPA: globin domain-containing protein [Pyrinomonadaceae bacterium]|jgi:nitric oxide dioxygenase
MTPQQILLVQQSFALVAADADLAADIFYKRLFALDAGRRLMFPADLTEQKRKLMATLKFAVETLDRFDVFQTALANLGRKHAGYGVRDEHYATVGAALIETLRQSLGAARFTPAIETAWQAMYAVVAVTMRDAARESSKP